MRTRLPIAPALAAAALLAGSTTAATAATSCANADLLPTTANLAKVRTATFCLLNAERTRRGLPKLARNAKLEAAGNDFAREMVKRKFFDHVSPSGSDPTKRIKATGYVDGTRSWSIGENIAWGNGPLATARQTVKGWMHSPGHKANILSRDFKEIGIGIAAGAPRRGTARAATYCTDFGKRIKA